MTYSRRVFLVVLGIAGAAALWYLLYRADQGYAPPEDSFSGPPSAASPPPGGPVSTPTSPSAAGANPLAKIPPLPQPVSTPLQPEAAGAANPRDAADASTGAANPTAAPQVAIEAMRSAIQKYGAEFGGNPVGTNAEITSALNGDNPAHAHFLGGLPGQEINSKGELVDPWGTPYFFHQVSGSDMEVRSAGPDRTMWDGDDVIFK